MTKREINKKYGIYTEYFSDKFEKELDRDLSEFEIVEYTLYIESFINYIQSDLNKD